MKDFNFQAESILIDLFGGFTC